MTAPTLSSPLGFSFSIESTVSSEVPGKYPCALNGRPLMIDDGSNSGWTHQGIQQIRQQADSATTPSEQTLNPQGLWRRAQESWHRGAGQTYRDKTDADEFRFSASLGIDPWTPYEISLLPDVESKAADANTNVTVVVAGSRLYKVASSTLKYTTDITASPPTWTSVTGYSGGTITGIASDGYTVYFCDGANIWTTNTGTSAATSADTTDADGLWYVKGRLMVAADNVLSNIPTLGSAASMTFTHSNSAFRWVGCAEGTANIYAAGYAGDKSLIYRIAVKTDGTALDAPIIAGELPDGEVVTGLGSYLGFILIGTTQGVRFAEVDGSGNLSIGPQIATSSSVYCFEGQERFVWFGWTNYDASHTGLGRMDLTQFTTDVVTGGRKPAYATDLMAATSGSVLSVVTFQDIRVFTVSGVGTYAQIDDLVASGTITSGQYAYGLPDPKVAISMNVQCQPLHGSFTASFAADGATATSVGVETTAGETTVDFPLSNVAGQMFETTLELNRDSGTTTLGPTINRWTVKASPGANDGPAEYLMIPFLLYQNVRLPSGLDVTFDVERERQAIKDLREARTVVTYQEPERTYQVQVENYEWHPEALRWDANGSFRTEDGTLLTQLKVIA